MFGIPGPQSVTRRDPFQQYVRMLILGQGPNGTTDGLVDLTGRHARTLLDAPATTTSQKAFGASSIQLDGTNDGLRFPMSDDFRVVTGGICYEGHFRRSGTPGTAWGIASMNHSGYDYTWALGINSAGHVGVSLTASSAEDLSAMATNRGAVADTTWTHIALAYDQAAVEWRVYVAGARTATIAVGAFTAPQDYLYLASLITGGGTWFAGNCNAWRITQHTRYFGATIQVPGFEDYLASLVPAA